MRCLNCRLDGILQSTQVCPKCGVYLPSVLRDVLTPGTLLRGGDYRIDYALGRGGFGITYRAAHTSLEKLVAIKEFYPQDQAHREGTTGRLTVPIHQEESYQRGLQRFEREGRTLARLNHPNVVSVVDLFKERGTAYLVMELLPGNTLKDELESQLGKRLPIERVKTVMTALVNALTAVHQLGIYHLDLKPDNVMLTLEERIVLVDFGASRQNLSTTTGSHQTTQSTRTYTLAYAAPEVITLGQVGAESDLFELGMMLYEMLTGKLPPSALNRLMNDNWIPQRIDEPWQGLVTAALQIKCEDRPKTVKVWWETVLRFEEEQRQREAERQRQETQERATAEEEQRQREAEHQRQETQERATAEEEQRQREAEHQRQEVEKRARAQTTKTIPRGSLAVLFLLYSVFGLLSAVSGVAGLWFLAVAVAVAVAVTLIIVMGWNFARVMAIFGCLGSVAGTSVCVTVILFYVFSWIATWAGTWVNTLAVPVEKMAFYMAFYIFLVPATVWGLVVIVTLILVVAGAYKALNKLNKSFSKFHIFLILAGISFLGLGVGYFCTRIMVSNW